jgi:hypothetical protein
MMKRAMTILVCVLAAGLASAQNPQIIQNTKARMDGVRNNATAASNEALGITTAAAPARKGTPATPKPSAVTAQTKAVPVASPAKTMPVAAKGTAILKPASTTARKQTAAKKTPVLATQRVAAVSKASRPASQPAAASSGTAEPVKSVDKQNGKWSITGKRDPFVSPVVSQSSGSGCSTGKKCLEIGAINLRGVVRSESGFIAVVTNRLNKAYFLRENDPVFDGYVVKITGDSIVFQETQQDRLGKTFTREVVKKITTPAV